LLLRNAFIYELKQILTVKHKHSDELDAVRRIW